MRNGGERVKGGMTRRRHAGIGDARMVEVERKIVRDDAVPVDVVEQRLVARAEQDAVMRDGGIVALPPEMDDEKRRRPALARETLCHLCAARATRARSDEPTTELQSLIPISYSGSCLKTKK